MIFLDHSIRWSFFRYGNKLLNVFRHLITIHVLIIFLSLRVRVCSISDHDAIQCNCSFCVNWIDIEVLLYFLQNLLAFLGLYNQIGIAFIIICQPNYQLICVPAIINCKITASF